MNLQEFIEEFINEIRNESFIQNDTPSNIFLQEMSDRLERMEYIFNPTTLHFFKRTPNRSIMKFDMFAFDEMDRSFVLVSNEYIDDTKITNLNQSDIDRISKAMRTYLEEVYLGRHARYIDASHDAYKLSGDLYTRLNATTLEGSIDRVKLIILTNKKLTRRVSNFKMEDFYGKQVELNVWDIERIYDIVNSGRENEPITIDVPSYNKGKGISFLKANIGNSEEYDAYISILPGEFLHQLYWTHGSRLLEGNVRAFLSSRGKINRAIRRTINDEPNKFFTYNNGIACTAKSIKISDNGNEIIEIEDFQIINGGQTTASLTAAAMHDRASLEKIFVLMKLTIIKSDDYEQMVHNISRFANSQNRVTDADLFSNHGYHIEMERLSNRYPAPPKPGENHHTYWYYERSRGKYEQAQFKMTKKSEKEAYRRKNPKNQVIVKEDLAKYLMAGIFLRPDLVSRGRAKNMNFFADRIDKMWEKDKSQFNELYFKEAVAYTILYRFVDRQVANSEWYSIGGIKLNIVPYTISKIISSIPKGYNINLKRIWNEQTVYDSFIAEIDTVARMANDFINDSEGVIPTEKAKKQETWETFKSMRYEPQKAFLDDLVSDELRNADMNQAIKERKAIAKINIETEIYHLAQTENGQYWQRLAKEGMTNGIISKFEYDILINVIAELASKIPKRFPTPTQYQTAWRIRKRLEEKGVRI